MRAGVRLLKSELKQWLRDALLASHHLCRSELARGLCEIDDWVNARPHPAPPRRVRPCPTSWNQLCHRPCRARHRGKAANRRGCVGRPWGPPGSTSRGRRCLYRTRRADPHRAAAPGTRVVVACHGGVHPRPAAAGLVGVPETEAARLAGEGKSALPPGIRAGARAGPGTRVIVVGDREIDTYESLGRQAAMAGTATLTVLPGRLTDHGRKDHVVRGC